MTDENNLRRVKHSNGITKFSKLTEFKQEGHERAESWLSFFRSRAFIENPLNLVQKVPLHQPSCSSCLKISLPSQSC